MRLCGGTKELVLGITQNMGFHGHAARAVTSMKCKERLFNGVCIGQVYRSENPQAVMEKMILTRDQMKLVLLVLLCVEGKDTVL